jgi:hypothetical protein
MREKKEDRGFEPTPGYGSIGRTLCVALAVCYIMFFRQVEKEIRANPV